MNILFLYRTYPSYGGVEVVTTVLANKFTRDGHHVIIASFEQPNKELAAQLDTSIEIVKLDYPVISYGNIRKLHQVLKHKQVDILVNQWGLPFHTTYLCCKAIRGSACKLVSVLHGSPYTSKIIIKAQDKVEQVNNAMARFFWKQILFLKEQVIKRSIRYNCKKNERYILLSKGFVKPLIKYAHIKNEKNIVAIGNPITIPVMYDLQEIPLKKKQLLYVGRMDYENKRVNRIIEAWETIFADYPDWELVLVGDGPHKNILIEYVKSHHIERVRFEGFQIDPPIKYYKEASIFLLTSDLEGFGLVITESMSYGVVPIVYGSYEAVYDIIEDGKSGFITSVPYSKDNTVRCIRKLIENPRLRNEMAENAISRSKKFTVETITQAWYDLFRECLN